LTCYVKQQQKKIELKEEKTHQGFALNCFISILIF